MNYKKNYDDYINYVKKIKRNKGFDVYYEKHHIIPKSMGGTNKKENLILLTAREHYLAHYLLWKIYGNKMAFPFWRLNTDKRRKINSKLYDIIKREISLISHKQQYYTVICEETGEEFEGCQDASNKTGIDKASIGRCCSGKQITAGKLHFKYKDIPKTYIKNDNVKRKIICVETNEIFNSIAEAADKMKLSKQVICRQLNGYSTKLLFTFLPIDEKRERNINKEKICKKVLCVETNIIYESITQAVKENNLKKCAISAISGCCNGRNKTAYGYHWLIYKDNIE